MPHYAFADIKRVFTVHLEVAVSRAFDPGRMLWYWRWQSFHHQTWLQITQGICHERPLQLSFCIFAAIIIWDGTAVISLAPKSYKEAWRLHLRTAIYVCSYMLIACVSLCMDNQILLSLTCLFSMQALDISSCQNISHLGLSSIVSSAEGLQQLTLAHGSSVRIWPALIFKH